MKGRKIVSLLLALTLLMTTLPVQVFAKDKVGIGAPVLQELETHETTPGAIQLEVNKYVGDGYEVEFKVVSQWGGKFDGEIILTNTGDKVIESWALKFDFKHTINSIWNAELISNEDGYTFKNLGWNKDIKPGANIRIGFGASWDDQIVAPKKYDLVTSKQNVGDQDYTIDFKITSDWGQGVNGEINITNNTEEVIEDWVLEFDFDRDIQSFWTAEIVEHTENHYIIKNAGYNANIKPGETIKLGFAGNPGNVDSKPKNFVLKQVSREIDYEKDSDGDGLPDWFEKEIGADLHRADTDGDRLSDGYEYYVLGTDLLKKDTDGNGIDDGDEDFDGDGLTNLEEYELGTDPHNDDTDFEGLTDGNEVYIYGTDPLKADTDEDGLEDGDEILFGFDPLNPDTDGNGILDGKEKIYQVYEENITEEEKPEITKVSVAFEGNGNLQKTTSIENMYNIDILSTDVVGLVGAPVEINTTSEFEIATITFHYDKAALGDVVEDDLCIMWYDEANQWYEILDQDSIVDKENSTISVKTNHFSTYLVVNRQDWYKAWNTSLDYRTSVHGTPVGYYDIALVLDGSGSMGGTPIANAKHAARSFVNAMYPKDRIGVITFNSSATTIANMAYAENNTKKEALKDLINTKIIASGGTATNTGLNRALDMLKDNMILNKKIIVLLCDGDVQDPTAVIEKAKEDSVKIYTVNFGSSGTDRLTKMAKDTGGKYYNAKTSEQLIKAFYDIEQETYAEIDMTDTDGDGLPDVFEVIGMQLINGKIVTSDPTKRDTDNDGLTDYKEIGQYITDKKIPLGNGNYAYKIHFNGKSDPRKVDTDGDGIPDNKDLEPLKVNTIETMFKMHKNNVDTNQIYVQVNKNAVTITAHINFTGDTNDIFPGTTKTYAETVVEGIQEKWKKDGANPIIGTDYDFVPELKGELITDIIYRVPGKSYLDRQGQKYFNIHIDNSTPGFWDEQLGGVFGKQHIPHMEGNWSLSNAGRIFMYKRDQRSEKDYPRYKYKAVVAHEFGHTLGLGDAYPGANGGKALINNAEISDGDFGKTGSIMFRNGTVYSNDVEMMLEAFATNKWQYPIDKLIHKKSRVVRLPQQFK